MLILRLKGLQHLVCFQLQVSEAILGGLYVCTHTNDLLKKKKLSIKIQIVLFCLVMIFLLSKYNSSISELANWKKIETKNKQTNNHEGKLLASIHLNNRVSSDIERKIQTLPSFLFPYQFLPILLLLFFFKYFLSESFEISFSNSAVWLLELFSLWKLLLNIVSKHWHSLKVAELELGLKLPFCEVAKVTTL